MKRNIVLLFFALIANIAYAQLPQGFLSLSPNQIMVENAVEKGILLFKQDFQLLDTVSNTLFGRNNQEMFGSTYSIAYKLKNVCVVSDKFISPWQYDENFKKIENNTYLPIVSKTQYRDITDSTMKVMNFRSENCNPIADNVFCYTDNINSGFSVETTNGEKDGWIVWLQYSGNLSESTEISIATFRHKVEFKDGVKEYELTKLNKTDNYVCGFYVVPNYSIGTIEFMFGGTIHKKNNKWVLVRVDEVDNVETEVENNVDSGVIKITPVEEDIKVMNFPDDTNDEKGSLDSDNQETIIKEQ